MVYVWGDHPWGGGRGNDIIARKLHCTLPQLAYRYMYMYIQYVHVYSTIHYTCRYWLNLFCHLIEWYV